MKTLTLYLKLLTRVLIAAACITVNSICFAADYYIAKNGNDNDPGTLNKPFASIAHAIKKIKKGDICFIRNR